jgi:hypothetical protein
VVESGLLARALIFSAIPAFLLGPLITVELGRLGISEVLTFMVSMPPADRELVLFARMAD